MDLSNTQLAERFRSRGLKATPQRVAIYRMLLKTKAHPSPEAVHKAVLPAMPSISLATVYKTLDALTDAGLVEQVSTTSDTKRYDANIDPHHHLVCTRCHAITDVHLPEVEHQQPKKNAFPGFTVTGIHIQVLGLCEDCRRRER